MTRIGLTRSILGFMASAALAGAVALPAAAQERPQSPPPPKQERPQPQLPQQQSGPSIEVSDKEVKQFAEVYDETVEIRQQYTAKFQNAEDQQEAQNIQKKANQEIRAVIEESSLSVDRYQEIARATTSDTELRDRILEASEQ